MKRADTGAKRLCRAATAAAVLALCLPMAWGRGQHNAPRQEARPHYANPRAQAPRAQNERPQRRQEQPRRQEQRGEGRVYGQNARPYDGYRMQPGPRAGERMAPMAPRQPNGYGAQGMEFRGQGYGARSFAPGTARPPYLPPGHLGAWLNQHQGVPLQQQEQLLRRDPSFNRLPQATQQRLVQQLHEVDQMPTAQRDRRLARAENLERMSPQQRAQVRESAQLWTQMPADRQAAMKSAFRDLRSVPPGQRQTVLNSHQYQRAFSPEERSILSNMLSVEPYDPPQR